MRHFSKKIRKFQVFFQKKNVLRFLSLRYSADFRTSRLVHLGSEDRYFVNCLASGQAKLVAAF